MATPKILGVCKLTNRNSWWSLGRQFLLSYGALVAGATLAALFRKPCMFEHCVPLPLKLVIYESALEPEPHHVWCFPACSQSTAVCDPCPCCCVSGLAAALGCLSPAVQKLTEAKLLVLKQSNTCIKYHTGLLHLFWTFVNSLCPVCLPKNNRFMFFSSHNIILKK